MSSDPSLARIALTLKARYAGLLSKRLVDPTAPRVLESVARAEADFAPLVSSLNALTSEERHSLYDDVQHRRASTAGSGGVAAPSAAGRVATSATVGDGAGEHGNSGGGAPLSRSYGSTDTAFKRAANATAYTSMCQLGDLLRRLLHPAAVCSVCRAPAGVIDTCRVIYGELLCRSCDKARHCLSACARQRYAALHVSATRGSRPVLVSLHPNDFVVTPSHAEGATTKVIGDRTWIQQLGL